MKIKFKTKIKLLTFLDRLEFSDDNIYFFLTLVVGIVSGLLAAMMVYSINFLTQAAGTQGAFTLSSTLLGLLFVTVSGYITTRHYPSTAGSGIPYIKVWLVARNGYIKLGQWLAKMATTILSLASGMPLGKEGPTVAIAAGVASSLGNLFSLPKRRVKGLLAVGAAGSLAALFNTPIAAVVFTLEEIVGDLNAKTLGSIIVSTVIASITARALLGDTSIFPNVHYELTNNYQLIIYLIIGLAAAFSGPLFAKAVVSLKKFNLKIFKGHKLTIIVASFLIMALVSQFNTQVLGGGKNIINQALLSEISSWQIFLFLLALKFFCSTISYGSGLSGGLFMPTLFMGAMLGGLVGSLSKFIFPSLVGQIGSYVLVGMGAYFASVVRAPFTSILIIFEMTQDYKIILPLMIANIASYYISGKFYKLSIYEALTEANGMHLPRRQEDDEILDDLHVEDAMETNVTALDSKLSLAQAAKVVTKTRFTGYPITQNKHLVGIISANEIGIYLSKQETKNKTVGEVCIKDVVTVYPDQSLLVAFDKLKKYNIGRIPVVSRLSHNELLGIVTAEDIVTHFGYHIREEEMAAKKHEKEFQLLNQNS